VLALVCNSNVVVMEEIWNYFQWSLLVMKTLWLGEIGIKIYAPT
jgi:hypothetical protein